MVHRAVGARGFSSSLSANCETTPDRVSARVSGAFLPLVSAARFCRPFLPRTWISPADLGFGVSKPMAMNNHNAAAEPIPGTNPQNPGTVRAISSSMEWFGNA